MTSWEFILVIIIGLIFGIVTLRDWHKERKAKRAYAKTNLGKIDRFKSIVLQKRNEMARGITLINKDIQRHKDYMQSLNDDLNKKQLGFIEEHIKEQMINKQAKEKTLGLYIEIIKNSIEETKTIENALNVLFKTVKFNQESTTLQEYDQKYNRLDESAASFSQYDFVDFSNDVITQLEKTGLHDEVNLDRILLQMEIEKDQKTTASQPNEQGSSLEESLLDTIDDSFSELMERFQSLNVS